MKSGDAKACSAPGGIKPWNERKGHQLNMPQQIAALIPFTSCVDSSHPIYSSDKSVVSDGAPWLNTHTRSRWVPLYYGECHAKVTPTHPRTREISLTNVDNRK